MKHRDENWVDYSPFINDVNACVKVMRQGGVVLYPTDTIWGLGCDPTNESAVEKVYELKKRPEWKSLLLLVDGPGRLPFYVDVPEMAYELMEVSDKPLTIVYPNARNLAKRVVASDGTVGIRVTKEPFSKLLCERFGRPIVSTSANFSGEPSPSFFDEISEELKRQVDYVVNYRQGDRKPCKPSGIIKLDMKNRFEIIR